MSKKNTKEKVTYTDPRARRLVVNAWIGMFLAFVPACFLGSFMTTSGGTMNAFAIVAVVAVLALASGSAVCLVVAPRVEARAVAMYHLAATVVDVPAEPAAVIPPPDGFTPVELAPAPVHPVPAAAQPVPQPAPAVVAEPASAPPDLAPAPVVPVPAQS